MQVFLLIKLAKQHQNSKQKANEEKVTRPKCDHFVAYTNTHLLLLCLLRRLKTGGMAPMMKKRRTFIEFEERERKTIEVATNHSSIYV